MLPTQALADDSECKKESMETKLDCSRASTYTDEAALLRTDIQRLCELEKKREQRQSWNRRQNKKIVSALIGALNRPDYTLVILLESIYSLTPAHVYLGGIIRGRNELHADLSAMFAARAKIIQDIKRFSNGDVSAYKRIIGDKNMVIDELKKNQESLIDEKRKLRSELEMAMSKISNFEAHPEAYLRKREIEQQHRAIQLIRETCHAKMAEADRQREVMRKLYQEEKAKHERTLQDLNSHLSAATEHSSGHISLFEHTPCKNTSS